MLDNLDRQMELGAIGRTTYDARRAEVLQLIRAGRAVEPTTSDRTRRRITVAALAVLAALAFLSTFVVTAPLVSLLLTVVLGVVTFTVATRPYALKGAERFESAARAERAASIKDWEAAYAQTHAGQAPPAGWAPPMHIGAANATTNGMAIASLVLSLVGVSVLGVIFGHVALNQISRTGQAGRSLALWGLALGYLTLAITAIVLVSTLAGSH